MLYKEAKIIIKVLFVTFLFVFAIGTVMYVSEKEECAKKWEGTEFKYRYTINDGCQVKIVEQYVNENEL